MIRHTLMTAATLVAIAGNAPAQDAGAMAMLQTADGQDAGHVAITNSANGTLFKAELTGLAPGWHSFHVHETGSCEDGFAAAGDHHAPDGKGHGLLADDGPHAGDLPNIHVHADGTARAHFFSARTSVAGQVAPMMDADGSAIVIHENPDSYQSDAGAGGRIACGVITQTR